MTAPTSSPLAALAQPGILAPPPAAGRSLTFRLLPEAHPRGALSVLATRWDPSWGVLGFGVPLIASLRATVSGLRVFPALAGPGLTVPSTQQAVWAFLRGDDRGVLVDRTRDIAAWLSECGALDDALDTFLYDGGRDLTGYEDGTENPKDDDALAAALVAEGDGFAGSSFVAVQRWEHDLARFRAFSAERRDATVGRRITDNAEFDDAPPSAHVKRTAQESFDPPTFMLRRSHPFARGEAEGLEFIAYGADLDRYERTLRHMTGADDGIVDALFTFSRPVTGGYYWCPPVREGRLDLRGIGA